ncbi:uncharacterized protein N7529_011005 [Penicillium soppii]|uniref:uncharacterized protein n=1 Tax=Penicillium soppii TaxID=69789 RepID=UPI0025496CCD|nr:uncharacterized protein N7529_011005 [Penicillium soppii]KAJ5851620.1 hypothetical protein N7529_011005 [Penicillium soppii]
MPRPASIARTPAHAWDFDWYQAPRYKSPPAPMAETKSQNIWSYAERQSRPIDYMHCLSPAKFSELLKASVIRQDLHSLRESGQPSCH